MKVTETKLPGCYEIMPQVFGDHRGWFYESYSKVKLPELDCDFVQDNHSYTQKKGTIRGVHFQNNPVAQGKLVRCVRGAVLDVAVDLRRDSPTYKEWIMVTDDVEFLYKADNYYAPKYDRSIRWDDPELGIVWGVKDPILSEKDTNAPFLKDSDINF